MKGLVIDEPWISLILKGQKKWEMRSQATAHRGLFALIRKGSGMVVGIARLEGCEGPMSLAQLRNHQADHRIPIEEFESGRASRWTTAWKLSAVRQIGVPVPYRHPAGAVIWVNLDPGVEVAVVAQLEEAPLHVVRLEPAPAMSQEPAGEVALQPSWLAPTTRVPVAADGTWFGPHLLRAGQYTVGYKGDERRFDSFEASLRHLAGLDIPRWRRPNPKGSWGIVSGIRWSPVSDLIR